MNFVAYAIIWWLILLVIGLIAFPLVYRICNKLPDKGYSISKILGLVIITYISWILPSLHIMKFGLAVIILSLLILAALSFLFGRKHIKIDRSLLKTIIITEAIFIVAFVILLVIVSRKPDIYWNYSDDYVHYGFYNSVIRSDYFPPNDPWFAGEGLEYYYGGHLSMATITMLSGVPRAISYEMTMPLVFALAVCAAYGLAFNITRRMLYGILAAIFVVVVGYLSGAFELAAYVTKHSVDGFQPAKNIGFIDWLQSFDFTISNRIIPGTINFYPYFSILQGDMHPMNMAIPFQLLFMNMAYAFYKKADDGRFKLTVDSVLLIVVLSLSLGFLLFVNSWDYPVYLMFFAFIILLVVRPIWIGLAGIVLSLFLYMPYYLSRGTGAVDGLGLVTDRTQPHDFTLIFALFLVVLASFLLLLNRGMFTRKRPLLVIICAYIVIIILAWAAHFPMLLILAPMVLLAAYSIYKAKLKGDKEFVLLLLIVGALLVLFTDIFFIDDVYGPPNERFNTVMKIFLSLWVFWAIAAALAIYYISGLLKGIYKSVWTVILVLLIASSLVHPLLSTISWSSGRWDIFGPTTGTLDGLQYLEKEQPGDYEAVKWLDDNIHGSPVILEATGDVSTYTSRVSALTGLPTVIGWKNWEIVWRGDWIGPEDRVRDVDTIYNTYNTGLAIDLLKKYDVEYIYVGNVELDRYSIDGLAKFDINPGDFQLIYDQQGVKIYKVLSTCSD